MTAPAAEVAPTGASSAGAEVSAALVQRAFTVFGGLAACGVLLAEPFIWAGLAGLFVTLLVAWRSGRGGGERLPLRSVLRACGVLFAFVAWGLFTAALGDARLGGAVLARHLDWLWVPVVALAWTLGGQSARRGIAVAAAGVFLLSCLVAALQYFGVWPPLETFASLAWTKLPFHRMYEAIPGAEGRFMGGGLLMHRLKFSHTGALVVLGAMAVALHAKGAGRAAAIAVALVGFGSIVVFPHARAVVGAVAGAGFILLVTSRLGWKSIAALALGGILLLFSVVALHDSFRERLLSSLTAAGSGDRGSILQSGLRAAAEHPLVGTGLGRFRVGEWAAPEATAHVREHPGKAHNIFLSAAAELGVPGALLLGAVIVSLAFVFRRASPGPVRSLAVAGLAFYALLGMTHDPLFHTEVSLAFMLVFGAGVGAALTVSDPPRPEVDGPPARE